MIPTSHTLLIMMLYYSQTRMKNGTRTTEEPVTEVKETVEDDEPAANSDEEWQDISISRLANNALRLCLESVCIYILFLIIQGRVY